MWKTTLYEVSEHTVELRELVKAGVNIWDFDYPSYYKGDAKTAFEQKVIDHFYLREIGQETPGRFLHMFRTKVREIMPYYLEMYKTVEIMHGLEDPFGNVDIVETFEQETTSSESGSTSDTSGGTSKTDTSSNTTRSNAENTEGSETSTLSEIGERTTDEERIHKFSNTPQGNIANIETHMSEASKDNNTLTEGSERISENTVNRTESTTSNGSEGVTGESETTYTGTASGTSERDASGTVTHKLTRKGNQGVNTYAHDMIEFRQSIIDVDMMIIGELNCLFLGVY